MKLISLGLIFKRKNFPKWNKSHAWVPTPIMISKSKCKIFYAGRDKNNQSHIGSFEIDLNKPYKILNVSKSPILSLGKLGYFDDSAVIPCQVFYFKNKYYLFYVGWTQGKKIPYMASIGLACSKNLSKKFKRYSEAPIIGRTNEDPIFAASCFVKKEKNYFKIYYTSNLRWQANRGILTPKYLIKEGFSKNLINWKFKKVALSHKRNEVALTRPWILDTKKNKSVMIYSFGKIKKKKNNYKIGMALPIKGRWKRLDSKVKVINNFDKFDLNTQEYAASVKFNGRNYVFYNGDNFGKNGIGLAIMEEK